MLLSVQMGNLVENEQTQFSTDPRETIEGQNVLPIRSARKIQTHGFLGARKQYLINESLRWQRRAPEPAQLSAYLSTLDKYKKWDGIQCLLVFPRLKVVVVHQIILYYSQNWLAIAVDAPPCKLTTYSNHQIMSYILEQDRTLSLVIISPSMNPYMKHSPTSVK